MSMKEIIDDKILEITPDVHWIGVLDTDIVTFDVVMETEYGTTYNSYFINADKKAIVETSKEKFWDTYIAKIKKLCDPSEIQYIILIDKNIAENERNVDDEFQKCSDHKIVEELPSVFLTGKQEDIMY